MKAPHATITSLALAGALACALAGCSATAASGPAASASGASDAASSQATPAVPATTRNDVVAALDRAFAADYSSVTFALESSTAATATVVSAEDEGGNQQVRTLEQSVNTTMAGEFDKSQDAPLMHVNFRTWSSSTPERTQFEAFVTDEHVIISQNEQLYADTLEQSSMDEYFSSALNMISRDDAMRLVDASSNFTLETRDNGDTFITMIVDPEKLGELDLIDIGSLPEGSTISTMVASYTIDPDNRFKSVRLLATATGNPALNVTQACTYTAYDATTVPDPPELQTQQQLEFLEDEDGHQYFEQDGERYYVDHVDEDGTVYYYTENPYAAADDSYYYDDSSYYYDPSYYAYDQPATEQPAATVTESAAAAGSGAEGQAAADDAAQSQGRAYITGYDGEVHYLDEEGSEIRQLGDSVVFIDSQGEWYFLSTDEGDATYDEIMESIGQ